MAIKTEHTELILREMFRAVGEEFSWDKTKGNDWFLRHSWPSHEAKWLFNQWLARFLLKHKYATKNRAVHEASKIACDIGWRSSDDGFYDYVTKKPVTL